MWRSLLLSSAIMLTQNVTASDDFFNMSLEELSKVIVSVPAAITKLSPLESPASITVITAEDIRLTPARNVYDLIEVYVPGAMWMNYEEGPIPGVRGSITNRNYKYLLLVNNRLMNNKAHYGAKSELEHWTLDDIDKIEIIRGPGSVTYGPGAVAGVISIITHNTKSAEGEAVSVRYVDEYDSKGVSYSNGVQNDNYNLYSFISITRTKGVAARQFQATKTSEAGFIGEDIQISDQPLDYFADYQDTPQLKLHLDIDLLNDWKMWFRYTQEGSTWRGNEVKSDFGNGKINQQGLRDRQLTATLEHKSELGKDMILTTMLSVDSFDVERRREKVRHPNPDHAQNFKSNFSETELFLRGLINWQVSDKTEVAIGAEYSRDKFGPGWGDSKEDMRLGDDGIIVSDPNSNVIGADLTVNDAVFVGSGWSTDTYSLFGEANTTLSSNYKLLFSGRLDKNTYTNWLFSPRIALITKPAEKHIVKYIIQRSQRMNTGGQLYVENLNGITSKPETLDSIEVAYNTELSQQSNLKLSYFYNQAEVIGWNNNLNKSIFIGDQKLHGIETEYDIKWPTGHRIGVSYSYVKQISWDLSDGLTNSGVSYSDYNQPLSNTNAVMLGYGNDINNWPNQAFKFFSRIKFSDKLKLHIDAHVFWDYQGAKDGLQSLHNAVQGEPEEAAVEAALKRVEDENAYEYNFRLNAALEYKPLKTLDIQFYIQNLLGADNNHRYSFDTGNDNASPRRVRFTEEPRTYGIRLEYKY